MDQRFCTGCGQPLLPAARFCRQCGSAWAGPASSDPEAPAPSASPPSGVAAAIPAEPRADGPSPGRHSGWWLAAGLALCLTAGGATWVLVGRASEPGNKQTQSGSGSHAGRQVATRAAAIDRGISVLDEPTTEWTLTPEGTGSDQGYFERLNGYYLWDRPLPMVADTLVVGDSGRLRAIEPSDGTERWQAGPAEGWMCDTLRSATLCAGLDDDTPAQWHPLDPDSGPDTGVTVEVSGFGRPTFTEAAGLWLTVTPTNGDDARLEAFDPSTGKRTWTVDLPAAAGVDGLGDRSDKPDVAVNGSQLFAEWHGGGWVVDLDQRSLAWSAVVTQGWVWDAAAGYRTETTPDESVTVLRDRSGNPLVSAPGPVWFAARSHVVNGTVGIGSSLYDVSTGEALWTKTGFDNLGWSEDGRVVVNHGESSTTFLDPRTGRELMTVNGQARVLRTRDALVLASQEDFELSVHDLSGTQQWSRPLPDDSLEQFQIVGGAIVVGTPSSVLGFAWSPGASAPDGGESNGEPAGNGTEYWTDCGSEPLFTPVEVASASGGMDVVMEVSATCPNGNWLYAPHYRISLTTDPSTSTGTNSEDPAAPNRLASGTFDFQTRPVWIPAGQTSRLRLSYGFDDLAAETADVKQAVSDRLVHVVCEAGQIPEDSTVPATTDGSHADEEEVFGSEESGDAGEQGSPSGSESPAESVRGREEAEADALARLKQIAAEDQSFVTSSMLNQWTPQLSSKTFGLVVNGVRYDYRQILAEHLRLRARYSDVRLTFSDEWNYTNPDFWVTVVDQPVARPGPVLAWCEANSFAPGDCFAKRIRTGPYTEGNIKMRKDSAQ